MQRYYLKPSIVYESVTDLLPTDGLGNQEIFSSRKGGSFAFGAHVTTDYEFEIGASLFKDEVKVDVASDLSGKYDAIPIYALMKVDNMDILFAFGNLKKGSENHIRAFTNQLKSFNITYEAQYISQEELENILNSGF